jgi:hypothetical protein
MQKQMEKRNTQPTEALAAKKGFRIVKLEERIAPGKGGNTHANTCGCTNGCGGSSASSGFPTMNPCGSIF